jgi:hypothetical protein
MMSDFEARCPGGSSWASHPASFSRCAVDQEAGHGEAGIDRQRGVGGVGGVGGVAGAECPAQGGWQVRFVPRVSQRVSQTIDVNRCLPMPLAHQADQGFQPAKPVADNRPRGRGEDCFMIRGPRPHQATPTTRTRPQTRRGHRNTADFGPLGVQLINPRDA